MARMVNCRKLGKELPGLDFVPFDDALGERLYREVLINWIAPVSPHLALSNIAERALGLPKSY